MTIYIFDTCSLSIIIRFFYRKRFPSFWEKFNVLLTNQKAISVREVYHELQGGIKELQEWSKQNIEIFKEANSEEVNFISEIFKIKHFQYLVEPKKRYDKKPVADPFVIAKAKILGGSVITEEKDKPNSAGIPTVCKYYDIPCFNLEGFMEIENWTF